MKKMAKEKNFLLVSLEEDKAKKLAQVISNDTCRKILDFLTRKEATETELSTELTLPISTVHYNLKQLVDSGLVVVDEYHYSQKGKEINHYSLANKYIIIAPKTSEKMPSGLRNLLPVTLLVAVGAAFLKVFVDMQHYSSGGLSKAMPLTAEIGRASYDASTEVARNQTPSFTNQASQIMPWFVAGALFALFVYAAYDLAKNKMKK